MMEETEYMVNLIHALHGAEYVYVDEMSMTVYVWKGGYTIHMYTPISWTEFDCFNVEEILDSVRIEEAIIRHCIFPDGEDD